ncbi:cell division cycle-associated protein 7-like [Abrus precatorius]|uniref:Cell division cycle-associated protein 7-like n=1 Tax=Abrus precatorius TaxID=3816 RepID=A0A8B8LU05_ABRPR|nr:cell division cycle-associated protein 7-like [Abrus precatorius]
MGRVREKAKCDYEALRKARMLENKARLESLGVNKTISQLQKPKKTRPYNKRVYGLTPLRRSQRINTATVTVTVTDHLLRGSHHLAKTTSTPPFIRKQEKETLSVEEDEIEQRRPANAPFIKLSVEDLKVSAEISAQRCNSKGRGSVYNSILGICCHFCRQKKLCGEEDCKRCGNCDVNESCLGKTDCSVCHSSTGVFCRACLKIRYGEEIEEVRENKGWMCPHCIEERGMKPYWICNSSICLRKRNIPPTGLAIYKAREMGYKSVAHLLMEELKRGEVQKLQGITT